MELRKSLEMRGLSFPHWEHVSGSDADLHVAILSRFPFTTLCPHTNDTFILNGQSFRSRRGFAEVDIQFKPDFLLTLIAVHLKSKNYLPQAREADFRLEEGKLLRDIIDARLASQTGRNLIVLGDFNDSVDSPVLKTIIGFREHELVDIQPFERGCATDATTGPAMAASKAAWTHY